MRWKKILPASILIVLLEAKQLNQHKVAYNPTNRQLSKYPTTLSVFQFIVPIDDTWETEDIFNFRKWWISVRVIPIYLCFT